MPLLDLDRRPIAQARDTLGQQREALRTARARHDADRRELERLQRGGADDATLGRQRATLVESAAAAREALARERASSEAIGRLQERLRAARDPAVLVQSLSAEYPVMLMPVALQTRYDARATTLRIRIYPDALHTTRHDPGLTPKEAEAGMDYWRARFADPAESAAPWSVIALLYGPMRAAHVVRTTTPTNVDALAAGGEPTFDSASWPSAAPEARETIAAALPDRFVAIGWRSAPGGGSVEMFRKWGAAVADRLPMSPSFDPLVHTDPAAWKPFADDRAWLVDYDAALAAGMAITVTAADLKGGTRLTDTIDGLVVLGVDWTQTPESAAALVGELLGAHHLDDGLQFVPQGTPTNNTAGVRAGHDSRASGVTEALAPEASAARAEAAADELASAGARAQLLLGVPRASFDLGLVPGAELPEGATAAHMLNALWNATLGYTLRYFWNPLDTTRRLIDDAAIEQLRAHAVRYLRASGPLAALRVGAQPYGILPVTARAYRPKPNAPLERELQQAVEWFRGVWTAALGSVPSLRDPSAESLHNVLAMQPWSVAKRFWQVAGPAAIANYPDIKAHAEAQWELMKLVSATLLDGKPAELRFPFLGTCAVRPKSHSLDAVPWVQRDPDHPERELPDGERLRRDYLKTLLELLGRATSQIRAPLAAMQAGESLLEALLAFAVDEEVLQAGRRIFASHLERIPLVTADVRQRVANWRPAEFNGVDTVTALPRQLDVGSAQTLVSMQLEGTTGGRTIEGWIGAQFELSRRQWPEHLSNIASLADSLEALQQRNVGELSLALRTTLDLAASRLDAWITSLATKRLDEMRERQPTGVHIGAWGLVEGLRPDAVRRPDLRGAPAQSADSLGYVHAPSIQQATTAAILRSGHVANRENAGSAFAIDLRSRRVKRARRLLEGLANGQSMAALLGYRFERSLRDGDLSQHILEFRRAFPLRASGEQASDEPKEAIAARDVIDGVRLVAEYRERGIAQITPAGIPAGDRPKLAAAIDDLQDQLDAVSDLLIAESVHHVAGGNMERAGAALQAIDRQQRPPQVEVVDTPHSTRGYTQRVVVAMQAAGDGAWPADDLAARVEPRLDAWLARLLGDPARYRCFARVLHPVEAPPVDGRPQTGWEDRGETLELGFSELGLSALALVLASEAEQGGGQSGVQERIALKLSEAARERFGDEAERLALVLDAEAPAGAPPGTVGLVGFESLAWLLRRLLEQARPLRRMDMVLAVDGVETEATLSHGIHAGVDLDELKGRLAIAEQAAAEVLAALAAALPAPEVELEALAALDPAAPETLALQQAVDAALRAALSLGWRSAIAAASVAEDPAQGDAGAEGERVAPPDTLVQAVARGRAVQAEAQARLDAAPPPVETDEAGQPVPLPVQAEAALARIRAVLGKDFPVLPCFTLGAYAAEAQASLGDRDTLLGKATLGHDDGLVAGWLPKLGCVREPVGRLADVISAAEAQGQAFASGDFRLLQFPRTGWAHWGALPPAERTLDGRTETQELRGTVAVAAFAPEALASIGADDRIAGLFVDEWSESLPASHEKTAIGFHFDAPGARPPQAVLLAVPADPGATEWTLDALVDTVREAMSLARLRVVRPKDLKGTGLVLPGLFLSQSFTKDVPSVDFFAMLQTQVLQMKINEGIAAQVASTLVDGKTVLKA